MMSRHGRNAMFRLFQNERQALLKAKKIRKYLAYATGEIVLVVIGILIALQFNNADLDRQDRKKERDFMVSMLQELDNDIAELDRAVAGNQLLLEGMDELLAEIARQPQEVADQRSIFLNSVRNTYWFLMAQFSEGTLSQLKYSGGFQLIEKDDVLEAILRYDQGLLSCKHQFENLETYFHVVEARQKTLFDLSLGKRAFDFIEQDFMNMLLPAKRFEEFIDEGNYLINSDVITLQAYYGDVLYYRTAMKVTNVMMSGQQELAESLTALISENYGIE